MTQPVLIVVAPYYRDIADQLIAGATQAIAAQGIAAEILEVPGALEIPAAIALAADAGRYSAFIALGCVIRGETTHYDTVANESARGLMDLTVRERLAIGNGILTCETEQQALLRANPAEGNKGGEAANAALALRAIAQAFAMQTTGAA
ncbi:MAG: 6,7-dimethyl-8-ribityllumazine synthase [Alphaproteobacteria bacterium]|nr:6,7-dimethyl-8-ribityllumazine synthase [Alphaproteobacteria bacterium]